MRSEAARAGAALAALTFALAAAAQQPAAPAAAFAAPNLTPAGVRALAATCNPCHGPEGRPAAGSTLGPLAGRAAADISARISEFRDGRVQGTLMPQIAKGFSDAEVAAIAEYFSRRPLQPW